MNGARNKRLLTLMLVFATLAMRASIPEGYMPSAPGTGLLYELCPSAVPAEVMQVLQSRKGGGHHVHHGHHGRADPATGDHSAHDGAQCPIGHLLASAVVIDMGSEAETLPNAPDFVAIPVLIRSRTVRTATSSRGPPA